MEVKWDEDTCIHAGNCVNGLPAVFKVVDGKFVINQTGASEEAIRDQVAKCPSGALTIE
ncbi:MAG: (4Fe-4S)-binding protein [Chromatiales bacterium]|nr:(4Fe-4S)-binding protein [Chromatiales bacterium]